MKNPSTATVTLLAALAQASCESEASPVAPTPAEDVTITLSVSGGFAGVDYSIEVDGAEEVVRGVTCRWLCDFQPGEVLIPLSAAQVSELARALDETGVLDMDGRDFGTQCCDDFRYELLYERGERAARVTGDGALWPPDLARVVGRLHGLVGGVVPALVTPDTRDSDWPRDAYQLGEVRVEGLILHAGVTYGGGCGLHRMDLALWGGWLESFPVQINALVTHDDGDDACDAVITEERRFGLAPLREAYEAAYGPIEAPTRVVLRLWDPLAASPQGRLVEVVF